MGLGLAFCRRTIEAHCGTIEVNTIEGKGTTFTLNIPTGMSLTQPHTEQMDEITVDEQA
jgi:K+-sensing histidine kinase KdpD